MVCVILPSVTLEAAAPQACGHQSATFGCETACGRHSPSSGGKHSYDCTVEVSTCSHDVRPRLASLPRPSNDSEMPRRRTPHVGLSSCVFPRSVSPSQRATPLDRSSAMLLFLPVPGPSPGMPPVIRSAVVAPRQQPWRRRLDRICFDGRSGPSPRAMDFSHLRRLGFLSQTSGRCSRS